MILASLKNVTQKRRFLIWDNRGIYIYIIYVLFGQMKEQNHCEVKL